ncbi:MAG TPA: glucokinase [Halioglobus sp.]
MPSSKTRANRVVADIGGTNCRLGLFAPLANELRSLRTYVNRDYKSFEEIMATWLDSLAEPQPTDGCLAVAAPPTGDRVTMSNIDWSFSCRELAARFGFSRLRCINDFEGNAYALPHLSGHDLTTLHRGTVVEGGKLATVGPGTGLGGSTLNLAGGVAVACASEPGHMGLAPATALELELFRYLQPRYGEIYAELLVSGPGLQRLYQTLATIQGEEILSLTPEQISARAVAGQCELCTLSLNTFCGLLGSISGDFVLANGAYGGLYLAGGIVPRMLEFLQASPFVRRFQQKGKMSAHLAEVPLYVITCETTGLLGAAHAPL